MTSDRTQRTRRRKTDELARPVEDRRSATNRPRTTLARLAARYARLATLITAIFAVPVALQQGLNALGVWDPFVAWGKHWFEPSAPHPRPPPPRVQPQPIAQERVVYFAYASSQLDGSAQQVIGQGALLARSPGVRFAISCAYDGAETETGRDADELQTARAKSVRNELLSEGVTSAQVLPGWDQPEPIAVAKGVREPLNRRCIVIVQSEGS